ncbi:MAG: SWIM zinc finger family protein [Streptosporangiaceae bacterium]
MSSWGGDWPPARPIRVDGGIRARSKRGAIGEQWWSRRFIEVLESFGLHGRLARGRSYARQGQVLGLEISAGYVTARVQGSRPAPYKVRLQVLPLTTAQWRTVQAALASRALFRAKLLAGEMPHEIEEVFADCGTPLFPRTARDLEMSCSCPDWGVPCKHLAAVCYVLAEAFDDDPFGILALRGRNREALLAALRRAPAGAAAQAGPAQAGPAQSGPAQSGPAQAGPAQSGPAQAGPAQAGPAHAGPAQAQRDQARPAIDVTDRPLAECAGDFWGPRMTQAALRALPVVPPAAPDLLLRGFEPPAVEVDGMDLPALLGPAYRLMAGQPDPDGQPGTAR